MKTVLPALFLGFNLYAVLLSNQLFRKTHLKGCNHLRAYRHMEKAQQSKAAPINVDI